MKKANRQKKRSQAEKNAAQLTPKIISDMKQNNHVLAKDSNTPRYGLGTYANAADKLFGAKGAITKVLMSCHATFEKGVENTSQRSIAIGASLFTNEIIQLVKTIAGAECYCYSMICNCLQIWMPADGTVGIIKLSNDEDQPRVSKKPRYKYYLIKK